MKFLTKFFKKLPATYELEILPANIKVSIDSKKTVLQSLLEKGILFPHNCRVGSCTTCKSKLLNGKVKELTDKAFVLEKEEIQENYILVCQSIPQSDLVIENTKWNHNQKLKATFLEKQLLTEDILEVSILLEQNVYFKAGQYINFYLDWLDKPRSYSMANKPDAKGNSLLKFFIRYVPKGSFTTWLFSNNIENKEFLVSSPEGNFYLRNSSQPILFIAGGSGLAPIYSILQDVVYNQEIQENQNHIRRKGILLFGVRTQKDLYKLNELNDLRKFWKNEFLIVPILSDQQEDPTWEGERGFLHEYLPKIQNLNEYQVYMCGPPIMIDKCIEVLLQHGLSANDIYFDKFTGQ
ncbi:MAG: 2Fe-2S iron-sulfur cluster-binding protein [Leptonema sp. (in: bacteria)]